mmetsp:Transcript_4877/g.10762  ORF Transcript_4877/g.10762 Transcript_4877/m.10762 type:complete len:222 (-) Transcript_4877:255-920(-)
MEVPRAALGTVANRSPSGSFVFNTYKRSPFRWSTYEIPPRNLSSCNQSEGNSKVMLTLLDDPLGPTTWSSQRKRFLKAPLLERRGLLAGLLRYSQVAMLGSTSSSIFTGTPLASFGPDAAAEASWSSLSWLARPEADPSIALSCSFKTVLPPPPSTRNPDTSIPAKADCGEAIRDASDTPATVAALKKDLLFVVAHSFWSFERAAMAVVVVVVNLVGGCWR